MNEEQERASIGEAKKENQTYRSINELDSSIATLETLIGQLNDQLKPILRNEPAVKDVLDKERVSYSVELAETIANKEDKIFVLIESIRRILDLLEI